MNEIEEQIQELEGELKQIDVHAEPDNPLQCLADEVGRRRILGEINSWKKMQDALVEDNE